MPGGHLGEENLQNEFCNQIMQEGMSVRATERAVADKIASEDTIGISASARKRRTRSRQLESLEQELKLALGTNVKIKTTARGTGQITIHFQNNHEFDRIRELLTDGGSSKRVA